MPPVAVAYSRSPTFFSSFPACQQAAAWRLLVSGEALPLPLGFALHLGCPPEPQRDGHFLLGDGKTLEPYKKQRFVLLLPSLFQIILYALSVIRLRTVPAVAHIVF